MVETIKRKVKKIVTKEEIVELKIELSGKFFDHMDTAKISVAEQRGYDITYGEYIEECMNDLMEMVNQLSEQLQKMSTESQYQEMLPEVKERIVPEDGARAEEPEEETEEETEEEAYQREMQKFIEVADDEVMYG